MLTKLLLWACLYLYESIAHYSLIIGFILKYWFQLSLSNELCYTCASSSINITTIIELLSPSLEQINPAHLVINGSHRTLRLKQCVRAMVYSKVTLIKNESLTSTLSLFLAEFNALFCTWVGKMSIRKEICKVCFHVNIWKVGLVT